MEILSSVSLASNSCACSTSVCSSDFTPTYHTSDHEQQKSTFNHFRTKEGYNPFLLYNTTVNTPKRNLDLLLNLIYAFWSSIWGVIHQGWGPGAWWGLGHLPPSPWQTSGEKQWGRRSSRISCWKCHWLQYLEWPSDVQGAATPELFFWFTVENPL